MNVRNSCSCKCGTLKQISADRKCEIKVLFYFAFLLFYLSLQNNAKKTVDTMSILLRKILSFLILLTLVSAPLRAADIVETFNGVSIIQKGDRNLSYIAPEDVELHATFNISIKGGTLKLVEDTGNDKNYVCRRYTGTIYRGQPFTVSLECTNISVNKYQDDLRSFLHIVDLESLGNYNRQCSGHGLEPTKAEIEITPSEYSNKYGISIKGSVGYRDGFHEGLPVCVSVSIFLELTVEGEVDKSKTAVFTQDNNAHDKPGETWPYTIPGAVVAALLGYGLTRRKGGDDGGGGDDDLPDTMELRIYKQFGDTLLVGAPPQRVYARIVCIKNGEESFDPYLTSLISITGDSYITATDAGMDGQWHCADIQAVGRIEGQDGIVSFTLNAGTGYYCNRLHFQIDEGQMHFAQDNLTLPARYKKEVRLPFVIDGMDDDAKVDVFLTDKAGSPSSFYDIHVEWNKDKEVQEAVIKDNVLEEKADSHTPGHFIELNMHLEAHNDKGYKVKCDYLIVRFYMGMVYDIGAGYDGYEVGCYLEEYNPETYGKKLVWGVSKGKTYVPHITKGYLRIYDYDENNHCILIVSPQPDPKLFDVKALDESEQHRVSKLGLNFKAKDTGHPRGTECSLICLLGLLDAPSRIDAVVQWGTTYKNKEYKCETQVLLCSQPRRQFMHETALRDQAVKQDREYIKDMEQIEAFITRHGLMERLQPLVKFMHLIQFGYLEDYGIDPEQAQFVHRVFMHMTTALSDYTFDEGYKPLTIAGEIEQWFKDAGAALLQTYREAAANPYLQVGVLLTRLVAGIFTMGESEGFFRLYDAVSIGMLEISMAEIYVNQGGDEVTRQMTVMAKEAAKWQIFMMGMQLCLHIAVTPVGGQAPLAVRASSSKSKPKTLPKVSEKQYSTGKKAAASQKVIKESTRRQQAARDEVRSPGARAKSKGRKPKKSLAEGIKRGETRAIHDINELETMMHRCKANPTPENLQQLRRAVINVQGNKQAMYRLKALGPEYNEVRKTFNLEMLKIYDETDQAVMYELAAKHGLSLDRMGKENVSLSNSRKLELGETITYDRDSTYFYIDDKGNKIYFGQKTTQAMYNRFFTEAATGYKGGSQKVADNFTKYMDGTVIEDVLNHPESFGKEDIKILTDSTQHYKPLNNAKQVRDTIIYKTKERLAEGDKLLKMAESIADPELRKNVEARAVSAYMEGNRQTWKDFKHFVDPYDGTRADINGRSFVTDNMRKAVEEIELMFESKGSIDLDELNVKLADRGYTASTLVEDIADAMYRAGGGV